MVFPLRKADGTYVPFLTRVNPGRNAEGVVTGWFGVNTDISEQIKAEKHLGVLSNELSHRIKNIFSVIAGLVVVSARTFPTAKQFASDLNLRISALASAHDYIRPHNTSLPTASAGTLFELMDCLLAPYNTENHVAVKGDDVPLGEKAAMSLALLLHELATNSIKYGSLSAIDGKVELTSSLTDHALRIDWKESDGPPVRAPVSMGFGSSLTRISIEAQLSGRITYDWQPTGLIVCSTVPRANLS